MSMLADEIKANQTEEDQQVETAQETADITWLIFSVNERQYAIEAPLAKEILQNMEIYPLPFVPDFIKGVINRHGEPYSVIDLASFLDGGEQKSSLFIVLNLPDQQFCVQITDVLDFHTAPESDIIRMTDAQENSYFSGTVEYRNKNVPIILLDKIYETIRIKLENEH